MRDATGAVCYPWVEPNEGVGGGSNTMTIWYIIEKNNKHEVYSQLDDGLSMKLYTARTREAAEAKLQRMGVEESPAPAEIKIRPVDRGPALSNFMRWPS